MNPLRGTAKFVQWTAESGERMAYKRKKRQGFLILHRNRVQLEFLTDEQRGQLLVALLNYSEFGEQPKFDGVLGMAFATMAEQIAFYADAWSEKCEQARLNRSKSVRTDSEQTSTDVDHRQPTSTPVNAGDQSNQVQNKVKSKSPHTPQGGGQGQVDEDFLRFWDAYPKKQKKATARQAFEKALRKTSLETMLQALAVQRDSLQ